MRLRIRNGFGAGRLEALARKAAGAAVLRAARQSGRQRDDALGGGRGTEDAGRLPATSRLGPVLARWAGEADGTDGGGGG